ncbi:MAG TPA: F0F1 ATP synthase subunit beta, partial [Pseudomonadales bacterium]|nr:F0F1 ATP synthase subunit beta [Pseudomonadales bacterium]
MGDSIEHSRGQILAIRGPVVDVRFQHLPPLGQALWVEKDDTRLTLEVFQHLDETRVRAIALEDTEGLARGMAVFDDGAPVRVAVGPNALGRLLGAAGEPLDELPPVQGELRPILAPPPALAD